MHCLSMFCYFSFLIVSNTNAIHARNSFGVHYFLADLYLTPQHLSGVSYMLVACVEISEMGVVQVTWLDVQISFTLLLVGRVIRSSLVMEGDIIPPMVSRGMNCMLVVCLASGWRT